MLHCSIEMLLCRGFVCAWLLFHPLENVINIICFLHTIKTQPLSKEENRSREGRVGGVGQAKAKPGNQKMAEKMKGSRSLF